MYYFRKKSKGKIIHTADCFHLFNTDIRNIGWFETLSEAYAKGYRLCKHCNPLFKYFKKEEDQIYDFCREKGMSVRLNNRSISVDSIYSVWKIAPDENNKIILYHKNSFETKKDCLSEIAGYHLQGDVRRENILGYLNYIIDHDYFRMFNPVHVPKKAIESAQPKKGTKKYRSQQIRIKKYERRQAINNVIGLIDSLKVPSAMTASAAM